MNLYKKTIYIFIALVFSSCSPINMLTRIKKTPRNYSYNYCVSELKAPKTAINKTAWIVYSDREKNSTTLNPGGKIKLQDLAYLQPLLVIGEKRDYLKVIKYSPDLIENGKLKKRKDAEFYGWIHRSKLILNNQSITDTHSGLKNKSLLAIADTSVINQSSLYFDNDSVKIFKTPRLVDVMSTVGLYNIVYIIKRDSDKRKVLISKTPYITPDNIESSIIGWVHSSLVQHIGKQLFIDNKSITNSTAYQGTLPPSLRYQPVLKQFNDSLHYKTAELLPIVDRSENRIFNVNGNTISYKDIATINRNLHTVNVVFLIEPGEKTIGQLPLLINAFQNIHAILNDPLNNYSFNYATVITGSQGNNLITNTTPFTSNFEDITTDLLNLSKSNELKPIKPHHAWRGLNTAVQLIDQQGLATNIIIAFGELGRPYGWNNTSLAQKAAKNNCRLLGYQIFSGSNDDYNNFVIQFTDLISNTAKDLTKSKRETIVYSDQVTDNNAFIEVSKNYFTLDYPKNSMTQGGIGFPEKQQLISFNQMTASIDSFYNQIKIDNNLLIKSFDKAFMASGNSKDKFDISIQQQFDVDSQTKIDRHFYESFQSYPQWLKNYTDSIPTDSTYTYQLLLSETEFENLRNVFESIATIEVDTKEVIKLSKGERSKQKASCNCPDDDYSFDHSAQSPINDSIEIKYRSTRKARVELTKDLVQEIYTCPICRNKEFKIKHLTLAQIHEHLFHAPTESELLNSINIKDISKKRKLSDKDFEDLLNYYKSKKETIEKEVTPKVSFSSFDETYFWVNSQWLP